MNAYLAMKERHQAEVNAFPLKWAFGKEQFEKAMADLGLKPTDTDKVTGIGGGGFMLDEDVPRFKEMFQRHDREREEAIAADADGTGFAYQMFLYELGNHEYCVTYDLRDTLGACGLSLEDLNKSPALCKALLNAKTDYLKACEANGWG